MFTINDESIIIFLSLIIILFCCLYIIGLINCNYANDYPLEVEYLENINLSNGDMVFVSYDNFSGKFISAFSSSIWSHTGIIYIDPVTLVKYVLEGAIYRHKTYRHFFKIPLECWMYFNRKSLLAYKKYNGPLIDSNFMWRNFEQFIKNCKLDSLNIFWAKFLFERDYYEYANSRKYSCFEVSIILAQNIGIYKKEKMYSSYFPEHMANNKITLSPGVSYDNLKQIKLNLVDSLLIQEDILNFPDFWKN
jgi:hypothetical protein